MDVSMDMYPMNNQISIISLYLFFLYIVNSLFTVWMYNILNNDIIILKKNVNYYS